MSLEARRLAGVLLLLAGCSRGSTEVPRGPRSAEEEPAAPTNASAPASSRRTVVARAKPMPEPPGPETPAAASDRSERLELTFVGDVIFGRYRDAGYDAIPEGDYPVFADIGPKLRADVVVGNLETPVVRDLPAGSPIGARYRFGASAEHAKLLVGGGFTAMSLANNHWWDMRQEGVRETPEILQELGIEPLGEVVTQGSAFRVETLVSHGWKLGFVAITTRSNATILDGMPSVSFLSTREIEDRVVPVVRTASSTHDLTIVVVHWGEEYADVPSTAQIQAAHALIDAGADLVIGHHPHVLQGAESYGDGVIAYSLGNFLFENINEPPRLTGVLRVRARPGCLERVVLHPAYIERKPVKHPAPATGYFRRKVAARMREVSAPLGATWTDEGDDLVLTLGACPAAER